MSVQIALLAPATRVASRKLGPTAGRRSDASPPSRPGGLRDEQVGEHVRQVRDAGHQAVVGVGVDRRGLRAEAAAAAGAAARRGRPRCALGGRQVPGGAVEQVRARVLHARRLGARERVPADEALVGAGAGERRRLVEPTSRDHAVGRRRPRAPRATVSGSAPTGAATNTTSAPSTAAGDVLGGVVDRAQLAAPLARTPASGS